jgi:hypothetical protein
MKKITLLTLSFISLAAINAAKAMIPVTLWFLAAWGVFNCHDGNGVCVGLLTAGGPQDGTFSVIDKEKLTTQLIVSPKTANVGSFIKDGNFTLPIQSAINPEVTKKEGLSGKYAFKAGSYKATTLKDGTYSINLPLTALK